MAINLAYLTFSVTHLLHILENQLEITWISKLYQPDGLRRLNRAHIDDFGSGQMFDFLIYACNKATLELIYGCHVSIPQREAAQVFFIEEG